MVTALVAARLIGAVVGLAAGYAPVQEGTASLTRREAIAIAASP